MYNSTHVTHMFQRSCVLGLHSDDDIDMDIDMDIDGDGHVAGCLSGGGGRIACRPDFIINIVVVIVVDADAATLGGKMVEYRPGNGGSDRSRR